MTDFLTKDLKRVIVCGGRDYADAERVREILDQHVGTLVVSESRNTHYWPVLVHGAAAGADSLADEWANGRDVFVEAYPANWDLHGRAAGPIRNQEMIDLGADLLIAFPGGRGTADIVKRAVRAGIPVLKIDW